ncbi:hypothetical protein PG990_014248 [Apiospora arundinis]
MDAKAIAPGVSTRDVTLDNMTQESYMNFVDEDGRITVKNMPKCPRKPSFQNIATAFEVDLLTRDSDSAD